LKVSFNHFESFFQSFRNQSRNRPGWEETGKGGNPTKYLVNLMDYAYWSTSGFRSIPLGTEGAHSGSAKPHNSPLRTRRREMQNRMLLGFLLISIWASGLASPASALDAFDGASMPSEAEALAEGGSGSHDTTVVDEPKHGSMTKESALLPAKYSITVVNKQKCCVDVYLDDNFLGSLPRRNTRLTVPEVPAGRHTLFAEECGDPDHWGPKNINLKKNFTWQLRD
jgi:hypothetical protein